MNVKENNWYYYNLDLIEESLQNNKTPVILIAGASSSGKSYYAKKLIEFLKAKNLKVCLISTDNYNRGVSEILFNKVNENFFNNTLSNKDEIVKIIKDITTNKTFSDKFNLDSQQQIANQCNKLLGKDTFEFVQALKTEFDKINFDEKSVYNLELLAQDINNLSDKKDIIKRQYSKVISEQQLTNEKISNVNVIVVEGIFALNDNLINNIKSSKIKSFIECDNKSLFLRRILRDKKITNCSSSFIIKNYMKYVVPAYKKFIFPSKANADFVIENNMTFEELRQGETNSVQMKINIPISSVKRLLKNAKILKCEYVKDTFLGDKDNVLRLREVADSNNKFQMFSLIHKGYAKYRFDKKLIRPVNTLLTESELSDIFKNQIFFFAQCLKIGLTPTCIETKKRYLISYNNTLYHLDYSNNKYTLEIDTNLISKTHNDNTSDLSLPNQKELDL